VDNKVPIEDNNGPAVSVFASALYRVILKRPMFREVTVSRNVRKDKVHMNMCLFLYGYRYRTV